MNRSFFHASTAGLTLIELLVVLTILATLATIAITSTTGVANQARYEATQRTLANVHDAILGPANLRDTDGTPLFTGFVADIGRLPNAIATTGSGGTVFTLSELLEQSGIQYGYVVRHSPDDPDVQLGTGWRGPYLQLPPGETLLRDGWGVEFATPNGTVAGYPNAHLLSTTDGVTYTPVVSGTSIAQVKSFGSQDNATPSGTSAYDVALAMSIKPSDYQASLTVEVQLQKTQVSGTASTFSSSPSFAVVISVFEPNPATGGIQMVAQTVTPDLLAAKNSTLTGQGTSTLTFTITLDAPLTAGPRALRAYYSSDSGTLPLTSGTSAPKSNIAMLMVRPGQNFRNLVITVP